MRPWSHRFRLDVGGLRVRALTWAALHNAVLLLAGPKAGGGPVRFFKWSGAPTATAVPVRDITNAPADSGPEAIVVYDSTRDVQVLFDQGDQLIGGTACKDSSMSS